MSFIFKTLMVSYKSACNAMPTCVHCTKTKLRSFPIIKTRMLHTTRVLKLKEKDLIPTAKELAPREAFFQDLISKHKDKRTFLRVMENAFKEEDKIRRGHVEFIYAALKYMSDFGVEGDLEAYKKLMDVFPKGRMIPKNLIQGEFYHFGRNQECGTLLLEMMERAGVCPDKEMGLIIQTIFSKTSHVYKKYSRMMYWMPKFKNLNPYEMPNPMPMDGRELAKLALKKMSVDPRTLIEEFSGADEADPDRQGAWVMSAQAPEQRKLLSAHPDFKPLFVEGPFIVWLRRVSMNYFVLRADPYRPPPPRIDEDDVSNLSIPMFGDPSPPLALRPMSIHEQEDGVFLGMCCTSDSSKDSLLAWIRGLRVANPRLDAITVLFKLKTSPTSVAKEEEVTNVS